MQSSQNKQLRRKRDTYRRSRTLGALPASQCHLPSRSTTQHRHQGTEITSSSAAAAAAAAALPPQSQPVLYRSSSGTSRSSVSSASVDMQHSPLLQSACTTTTSQRRLVGRTPSSPSVLLSRMRELIREKVVETTVDRSDMAAVQRERRQRAADAFVEALRRHHHQQQHVHRHSSGSVDITTGPPLSSSLVHLIGARRQRIRSDPMSPWLRRCSPGPETMSGDIPLQSIGHSTCVAKNAFRQHRSTSEDTNNYRHRTPANIATTRRLSHDVNIAQRSKG